jgi:hypothetical protein
MDGSVTSRHLGLDLGGTNLKWAVVERSAGEVRTLATGGVSTRTSALGCRSSSP